MRKKSREERDTIRNRLSRLKFRATELEVKIDTELFDEARVVACTLVGSANRVMMNRHFTTLFIDEAAQALEAACWIAIGKADRVILAGDHHQLPPTIKCIEAEREGLGRTLMQKIAHAKPETVSLLKVQYRMHEDIMRFSSQWFYHVRVRFHGKYERGDHEPCQQARGGIARGTITLLYTENIQGESAGREYRLRIDLPL